MRKRSRVALFSLLIAVSGVVAWVLFSPEVLDPMYKGKALSKWMKEVAYAYYVALDSSANQGNLDEVSEKLDSWAAAVRQSGTNAIPLLLNSIRASDSNLKFKFYGLLERQHFIKVRHIPAEMLNQQAQLGFETLGSKASSAIPELIRIYKSDPEGLSSAYAAESLAAIGPVDNDAVMALVSSTTNKSDIVRRRAMFALSRMHADPKTVVPVLTECLKDNDGVLVQRAADALAEYGKEAVSALPELRRLKRDQDASVRDSAVNALKLITGEAAAKTNTGGALDKP